LPRPNEPRPSIRFPDGRTEFARERSYPVERRIAVLEGAPKLVAELPPQASAPAIPALVDIANPICRFLRRACPEIQGDLRLGVDELAKAQEFIRAEVIVLGHAPGKIQSADALLDRPDAVPPVIRRRVIASETNDRAP